MQSRLGYADHEGPAGQVRTFVSRDWNVAIALAGSAPTKTRMRSCERQERWAALWGHSRSRKVVCARDRETDGVFLAAAATDCSYAWSGSDAGGGEAAAACACYSGVRG